MLILNLLLGVLINCLHYLAWESGCERGRLGTEVISAIISLIRHKSMQLHLYFWKKHLLFMCGY